MSLITLRIRLILVFTFIVTPTTYVFADLQSPAITRPTRPQMPTSFDRETVARLLANIDKPYNASALKVGYFLRRGQPPFPVIDGFELLQTAAQAELVGTNKWFRLQNLLAFAAFRVPGADTSQGFDAYETIFNHATDAGAAGATYSLRQSIGEFVDSVPGKFNDFGLSKDDKTKELLLKAWTAYAISLSAPMKGAAINEPDWKRALVKSESLEAFVPAVEKILADPKVPKSFGLLVAAASVLAPKNPDKALVLWEQAKPLIPQEQGKTDINEAARLYLPLVETLEARDALPQAIKEQSEFVALTARGQAHLMLLLRKSGDVAASNKVLAQLNDPKINEKEIYDAASGLFKLARAAKTPDSKAGEQAEALLTTYLAAPRTRDFAAELRARLSLGNAYSRAKKWDEAKKVLTFDLLIAPETISPMTKSLLRDVERMKTQVQKGTDTVVERN